MIVLSFSSEALAIAAEAQIVQNMNLPKTGTNAATGQEDPGSAKTISWSGIYKKYQEDKWYFEKPKDEFMNNLADYDYTIEETDNSWVKAPEGI